MGTTALDALPSNGRQTPFQPNELYEKWRDENPLKKVTFKDGEETWLVLGHDEALHVLGQTDSLTSNALAPGFPFFRPGKPAGASDTQIVRMDPPLHTKFRKIMAPFFSAKRIESWRPEVGRIIDVALTNMLDKGAPADFFADFSLVVPSQAICLLLGVDYGYHEAFERLSPPVASIGVDPDVRNAAIQELYGLVMRFYEDAKATPNDGAVSRFVQLVEAGEISYEAALGNIFILILGGHETTAHTIAHGTIQLLQNPHLVERIKREPAKMANLVEEMLRTQAISDLVAARATTAPITVGDVTIGAHEGVVVVASPASHDPRTFPNPHEIDLDRDNSRDHLGFGGGIHSCLGQNLARLEMSLVFSVLFDRIPTLHLVDDDPVEFRNDAWLFGMNRMPVSW